MRMKETRGNIVVEMAIALIIIVMITGIVLNMSEMMTGKAVTATERQNMEMMITEVVDNLVNNPGTPENWHEHGKGTPGLAIVNEEGDVIPNSVSLAKFMALKKNYKKLVDEKLFGSKIKTSMELTPQQSSISSVKIGNEKESGDILSVNRLVRCDFYKSFVLKDFQYGGKCNHRHSQDKCSCNYFKVFPSNLRSSDYYLLIDPNEDDNLEYIIDTTRVVKARDWQTPSSDEIYLNDEINFYDDTSAVVFIHFNKPHARAVLVSVPKHFKMHELNYDYFRTNECNLMLKAWF